MKELFLAKPFQAARVSSYDTTGRNGDAWPLQPGECKVLADLQGPGVISHIWCTVSSRDPFYLRKLLLRIYWDDEAEPSVECPLGDFFGLGHSRSYTYQCALFSTTCNGEWTEPGEGVAMNCWIPMPFRRRARIEVVNEQDTPVPSFYFYIDYQKHAALPEDALYFHAFWKRENPCRGWQGEGSVWGTPAWEKRHQGPDGVNLTGRDNYVILDAVGRGHFLGVNMSIDHLYKGWWGEGDDMFFIDRMGDNHWPPDLHGTGSEDYLCHAWGMQHAAQLYCGEPWAEKTEGIQHHLEGKVCVYRYHVLDPIPFSKSLRVTIEHGDSNDRSDDFSSVAYWYQDEPHTRFAAMLPAELRLPD